ncbi:MAG: helix-turn-helix domain-containing protein [Bacilli bacterium]|nr:helix-turn-helix domain-containing protein [Bacilli bacterium]
MGKYTNKEYLQLIGKRIKEYRVYSEISQKELEEKTGISTRTLSRLEAGNSIQVDSLIKILTALNLDENIDLLIPDQSIRPSAFLNENKGKQRVYKKKNKAREFKWGDEE